MLSECSLVKGAERVIREAQWNVHSGCIDMPYRSVCGEGESLMPFLERLWCQDDNRRATLSFRWLR
jgi:hypothetical protein